MNKWFVVLIAAILLGAAALALLFQRAEAPALAQGEQTVTDPQTLTIPRWFLKT